MTKFLNRFARPVVMALSLGALMQPVLAQDRPTQERLASTAANILSMFDASVTGSYMAGQQALQDLRTDEAARYFNQAAQEDWDNPILVERAFIGYAADGQIGQAASIAKHLLDLDANNELAKLVVATEALKERRYGAAESMLASMGKDSFTAITGDILRAWAMVGDNKPDEADQLLQDLGKDGLGDFLVFHRALMAEASGQTDKAIELAGQAFDAEPNVARIVEVYARILANAGSFDEAKDVIAQFEAQGLTHPIVTVVKDAVDAGQRPGIFAANVQVGAAEMYHGIGVALSRDGSMDLALVFLRLGLYLDPSADVISLALGQLLDGADQHEAANVIYNGVPATSAMKSMAVVRVAAEPRCHGRPSRGHSPPEQYRRHPARRCRCRLRARRHAALRRAIRQGGRSLFQGARPDRRRKRRPIGASIMCAASPMSAPSSGPRPRPISSRRSTSIPTSRRC